MNLFFQRNMESSFTMSDIHYSLSIEGYFRVTFLLNMIVVVVLMVGNITS